MSRLTVCIGASGASRRTFTTALFFTDSFNYQEGKKTVVGLLLLKFK